MNKTGSENFFRAAQMVLALAGIFFAFTVMAQDDQSFVESRYLFIFSTSAEMKNRVPATEAEINQLLSLSMNGNLNAGDSIGIWTFDKTLHVGQFPLITWQPNDAVNIAKAINKFVGRQRYYSTNNFGALLPVLERVIQGSPRLTVLIFCDGGGQISGTPYDDEINTVFKERFAAQKNTRQPFIIVLRSQFGKYAGSSVNFPPGMVNLPAFPPLPKPESAAPSPPIVINTAPLVSAAPLVVIGTKVETNWQAYQFTMTNVPEPVAPAQINAVSPAESNIAPASATENSSTNVESNSAPPPKMTPTVLEKNSLANSVSKTNDVSSAGGQNANRTGMFALAAGFLIGAIALTAIFIFRSRREHGSLISRSMKK
jgi:hypothetical protein